LIEVVGKYLTIWSESKECRTDYESKNSEFFGATVSSTKSRFLILVPGPNRTFTLTDSMRTCLDSNFANDLSRDLQCKVIWTFVVGNTLSYSFEYYENGDLIESKNVPTSDGNVDISTQVDVEQVVFQWLGKFGIEPNLRFVRFDKITPIKRDVELSGGTSYMFQVAADKKLFSKKFLVFGTAIQIEILNNATGETVSAFPDFEETLPGLTAIDNLLPSGPIGPESIRELVAVLELRSKRYIGAGYQKVVYIVPNGILLKSEQNLGQSSLREHLKSRISSDFSNVSFVVY
jgi:hypothetical protein